MVQRSTLQAPSPGTAYNYVVVVATRWQSILGISRPQNVGECTIYLNAFDSNDNVIREDEMRLDPGDIKKRYIPSKAATKIVFVCDRACYESAILEYDTPNV